MSHIRLLGFTFSAFSGLFFGMVVSGLGVSEAKTSICADMFAVPRSNEQGFVVDTDVANMMENLIRQLADSNADRVARRRADEIALFSAAANPDGLTRLFVAESVRVVDEVEFMILRPNFVRATSSALELAKNGSGQIFAVGDLRKRLEAQNADDPFYPATTANDFSGPNLTYGLHTFARLFDPLSRKSKSLVRAYHEALEAYVPDAGRFYFAGIRLLAAAKDIVMEKHKGQPFGEKMEAELLEINARLQHEGLRDQDVTLEAELRGQFAMLMLYFKKSAAEILNLRLEAKRAIESQPLRNKSNMNDELVLGLVSVHLETGIGLNQLVSDLLRTERPELAIEFSMIEKIWILRMAQAKKISVEQAAYAVWALQSSEKGHRVVSLNGMGLTLDGRHVENMLLALLTYSNLSPAQVIAFNEMTVRGLYDVFEDASTENRLASLLARSLLVGSGYSDRMKYIVAFSMTGAFTREE